MTAEEFFNNVFGADVEKVHRNYVIEIMRNFAEYYLIRELTQGLEDMFETVKREDAYSIQKLFGADDKIVSKKRFKAKLIIEVVD